MKKTEIKYYDKVLSKLDIISIGLIIRKYEKGIITYQEMKNQLQSKNITLKPVVIDFSTVKVTIKAAEELKKRISTENYIPSDLNGYLISGVNYQDVLVRYDRAMIEALAEYGDEDSKKALESLVKWEESHSLKNHRR